MSAISTAGSITGGADKTAEVSAKTLSTKSVARFRSPAHDYYTN